MNDGSNTCSRCGRELTTDFERTVPALCAACLGVAPPPGAGTPPPAAARDPLVGQMVGEFEILERLGGDVAGGVYKARQTSLGRVVALKLLAETARADAEAVARFVREAEAAAVVKHRHLVGVHYAGCAGERHFIAMKFVAGESLAAVLEREGSLPPDRALGLMTQLAEALEALHAAGVIHGHIEPSNILITPGGEAKLVDFGLARRAGVRSRAPLPPAEARLYYPPEAARRKPLDERADLFLLGATIYHAIAGRPPLDGATAEARALQYARKDAPPLSDIVPTAPMALCRVIGRLLRRKPGDRYPSAADLLDVLERIESALSRPQAETSRVRRGRPGLSRAERRAARRGEKAAGPMTLAERAEAKKRQERQVAIIIGAVFLIVGIIVVLLIVRW